MVSLIVEALEWWITQYSASEISLRYKHHQEKSKINLSNISLVLKMWSKTMMDGFVWESLWSTVKHENLQMDRLEMW